MADQLDPGQSLQPGGSLTSENGQYTFTLQTDGNICLYKGSGTNALWCSGTNGKGITVLLMQEDGNLVGYDSGGHAIWASDTSGNNGAWCELLNEGRIAVSKVLWGKP